MKVLLAIKSLNARGGGAERVFAEVANGLARRDHAVEVMTFDYSGESFYELAPGIARHDMHFVPVEKSISPLGFLKAIPRIRRTVRRLAPDVVIGFMHSTYIPLSIALRGLDIPQVASEHTEALHYADKPFQRWLRERVEGRVRLRTMPSHAARRSFEASDGTPVVVVANPIPLDALTGVAGLAPDDPPIVLSLGAIRPEKDQTTLIHAFTRIAADFPQWQLRLVGEGSMRGALESLVKSLGMQDRIEMPGATQDIASAYRAARFVVLPSRYESFGMVAAEALAAGRPVLAFDDCRGVGEIVEDGETGLLVSAGRDDASRIAGLTEGLRRLMGDPAYCAELGSRGPETAGRYDIEAVIDQWEAIMARAVSGAPGVH